MSEKSARPRVPGMIGLLLIFILLAAVPAAAQTDPPLGDGPGGGPWVNYDFVPGDQVLFFEIIQEDVVGNFPRRLEFLKGNMEVAEWQGRRWIRASQRSEFAIDLPAKLPDRFTMEFDYFSGSNSLSFIVYFDDDPKSPNVNFAPHIAGIRGGLPRVKAHTRTEKPNELRESVYHCRIMADGDYVKVYVNEQRVSNVPKAPLGRSKRIRIHIPGTTSNPVMATSFRIAGSGHSIIDRLLEDGEVTAYGILFHSGSARRLPESTPTLKQVCEALGKRPSLTLGIEGHTDSVGDDAANEKLSAERAESVLQHLAEKCGVPSSRLVASGRGEKIPVAPNDSAEGRALNRRVVFRLLEPQPEAPPR